MGGRVSSNLKKRQITKHETRISRTIACRYFCTAAPLRVCTTDAMGQVDGSCNHDKSSPPQKPLPQPQSLRYLILHPPLLGRTSHARTLQLGCRAEQGAARGAAQQQRAVREQHHRPQRDNGRQLQPLQIPDQLATPATTSINKIPHTAPTSPLPHQPCARTAASGGMQS